MHHRISKTPNMWFQASTDILSLLALEQELQSSRRYFNTEDEFSCVDVRMAAE